MTDVGPLINFNHLDYLSPRIQVGGKEMIATAIYADAPDYAHVGAPGEGISALDDVARAAVAYLDEHQRTGDAHALSQGRAALEFTLHLQQRDGRFANFITDNDGTINMTGITSKPGLGWWTFRGMWALARGYKEFAATDAAFAAKLLSAYDKSEGALVSALDSTPDELRGRKFAPDAASVAMIALSEMYESRPNVTTHRALNDLADVVAGSQIERGRDGALSHAGQTVDAPQLWHAWGAHQGEALARAGELLDRADLVGLAKREVEGVAAWQLAAGRIHELTPSPRRSGQQAYGVTNAVRAAMALHRVTGDERYAQIAGLHASWFLGNNSEGAPMYDAATGRGYDGIDAAPRGINRSSGAESTIEALMALQSINGSDEAQRFAQLQPARSGLTWHRSDASSMRNADGSPAPLVQRPAVGVAGARDVTLAQLSAGTTVSVDVEADQSGEYVLLAGQLRPESGSQSASVIASIDGQQVAHMTANASASTPHVALDRFAGQAFHLEPGKHTVTLTAQGGADTAPALLESIVLHPARAESYLSAADGREVTVGYDLDAGRLTIDEGRL